MSELDYDQVLSELEHRKGAQLAVLVVGEAGPVASFSGVLDGRGERWNVGATGWIHLGGFESAELTEPDGHLVVVLGGSRILISAPAEGGKNARPFRVSFSSEPSNRDEPRARFD